MALKKQALAKVRSVALPRASVTFPPELHKTLKGLAKKLGARCGFSWEAAEMYLTGWLWLFGVTLLGEK